MGRKQSLPVTIVVTTWMPAGLTGASRWEAMNEAIESWEEHLKYDGKLLYHFADDGSSKENTDRLKKKYKRAAFSSQKRKGVGASLNAGFTKAFEISPLVAYFVDDWRLDGDFDLTPWALLLINEPSFGMVRFGPPSDHLTGQIDNYYGSWALRLDRKGYVFSHRPAIYHERFYTAYGPFLEGVNAVECEEHYHSQVLDPEGPDIGFALPCPWIPVANQTVSHITP